MGRDGLSLLQGTLDLVVLGILAGGRRHGYGIAESVRDATSGDLTIQDGALYQALHRLERQGLVDAEWGASEHNRRARFYSLTPKGRRRVRKQAAEWHRYARALGTLLKGV